MQCRISPVTPRCATREILNVFWKEYFDQCRKLVTLNSPDIPRITGKNWHGCLEKEGSAFRYCAERKFRCYFQMD